MANHVKELLCVGINSAKYVGIKFDRKHDISYTGQMSEPIRYVWNNNMKVEVRYIPLGFVRLREKAAVYKQDNNNLQR